MNIDYLKQFTFQEKKKASLPQGEAKIYRLYFVCWIITSDKKDWKAEIEVFPWPIVAETEKQKEKCFNEGWALFKQKVIKKCKKKKAVSVAAPQAIPKKFADTLEWASS